MFTDMETYNKVDKRIHQLSQILAKLGRSFGQKQEDDSHTNLYFDPVSNRLMSRWVSTSNGKGCLGLNLDTYSYEWLNHTLEVVDEIGIEGKTTRQLEARVGNLLAGEGLDVSDFATALHFEIPSYSFADEPWALLDSKGVEQWKSLRSKANEACLHATQHFLVNGEIRIWPHHFDTGIYVEVHGQLGVGFGFAMEDSLAGSPYFYLTGYPATGTLDFESAAQPGVGKWLVSEYWQGAVLPITSLEMLNDHEQRQAILTFISEAGNVVLNAPLKEV